MIKVFKVLLSVFLVLGHGNANGSDDATSYLSSAERYTVKIRTTVKYPPMMDRKGSHSGAGFLIDAERGWIATNAHVSSRNPESVEVSFKGKPFVEANLIFVDRYLDLAVLQLPVEHVPSEAMAANLDCDEWPRVGSRVGAYGHPMSLDYSVTTGIISGLRYKHSRFWVQTDTAINSGNSGGPLINEVSGEVIGINTMVYSKDVSEGLGFAVPIVFACRIFELLKNGKDPSVPYLPVAFASGDEFADRLIVAMPYQNLPVEWPLMSGDELQWLEGDSNTKLRNQSDLIHALRGREGEVPVQVLRDGKSITLKLTAKSRPRLVDWVGLSFSGLIVGNELLRDAATSNPDGDLLIVDVAQASQGAVVGLEPYSYISSVDSLRMRDLGALCKHLEEAADGGRKVRIVTRDQRWEYMSASEYKIFELPIRDLRFVGPRVAAVSLCDP